MAEICEISQPLTRPLTALDYPSDLLDAIISEGIVLVRGWTGAEGDFVELGRRFGVLERATPRDWRHNGTLFRVSGGSGELNEVGTYWHADGFAKTTAPALITIYHVAKGASPTIGTAFIDGCFSWSKLPEFLRERVRNRWWIHPSGSRHRFVVKHYVHETPVLLVNTGKICAIDGMNEIEMRETVTDLECALDRMSCYIHPWNYGDILLVDNRRMLHRGPKKVDQERILWRTSVVKYSN